MRAPSSKSCSLSGHVAGQVAAWCLMMAPVGVLAQEPVHHFGAQVHFGQGWDAKLIERIPAAGIADVRDELYWQIVEPTAGNFAFPPNYDGYMAALRQAGVAPLITLSFENRGYDAGQTPYTPAGFAAYARYATEVLKRYGGQIKAVEIWNEFNGTFAKGPATNDRAGTYLEMLTVAYPAIKAVRPDVTVVAGATAGVPLPYFEKLFSAGALNYLDVVSVHPYRTASTPEGLEVQITALRTLMAKYGPVKPIWVTEIGWPLRASAAAGDLEINDTTQAQFLVRACALLASAGVPRVYWYEMRDDNTHPQMGLVLNIPGFVARPAFSAMRVLNANLRYARFVARERTAPDVYSLRFAAPDGRELRVLWSLTPLAVAVPAGTTVTNLLGEPQVGSALTVGESPVYVSGPLPGLPGAESARIAGALTDSVSAFSLQQGAYGWEYGYFMGEDTKFTRLATSRVTDWKEEWGDRFIGISITNADQHPSKSGVVPVSVVRRWTSNVDGDIRITAHFKCGLQGDGVRVRVLADGRELQSAVLSTGSGIAAHFNFTCKVKSGTPLDFAVDPGRATHIDHDVTQVSITLENAY